MLLIFVVESFDFLWVNGCIGNVVVFIGNWFGLWFLLVVEVGEVVSKVWVCG